MNIGHSKFSYCFNDITHEFSSVQINEHKGRKCSSLQVGVNDKQIISEHHEYMPSTVADLIDLAVAIYTADRCSHASNGVARQIKVTLPVRNPLLLTSVISELENILDWFTQDHWVFEFTMRQSLGRLPERQSRMRFSNDQFQPVEIALWSGGLDSLAGLCNRLYTTPSTHYVLFGTGASNNVQGIQRQVAQAVNAYYPNQTELIQAPFRIKIANLLKNRYTRSRGFVFMLLGTCCAYMKGQDLLHIYENGIGAINLPYKDSEVGLDHTRAVHPRSLIDVGKFVSKILDTRFSIHNPFLFQTKAQICEVFTHTKAIDLIFKTITCDRRHREENPQCGFCSSCLLRRQALAAAGLHDQTQYVVSDSRSAQPKDRRYLEAMLHQIDVLQGLLTSQNAWMNISKKYFTLAEVVDWMSDDTLSDSETIQRELLMLYQRYVREWESAQPFIEQKLALTKG